MFDALLQGKGSRPDGKAAAHDEIDRYLRTETEVVDNPMLWWAERRAMYPGLSRMALDYLSIPGTFIP